MGLREWLMSRPEQHLVTVSHYGTIDNFLNREGARQCPTARTIPWQPFYAKYPMQPFHTAGRVVILEMENAGFRAVVMRSGAASELPSEGRHLLRLTSCVAVSLLIAF